MVVPFHLITPAGSRGEGFGIRDLGSPGSAAAVGNTWTPTEETKGIIHGFIEVHTAGGAPLFSPTDALIPPAQILVTSVRGISQAAAVGFTVDSGTNLQYPFVLDRNGFRRFQPSIIPSVPPVTGSVPKYAAFGINDVGVVVGTYPTQVANVLVQHGFALAAGFFQSIDYPPAATLHPPVTYTNVKGINNCGEIVGRFDDQTGTHGFRSDYSGGYFEPIDFINPSGTPAAKTVVNGINDSGDIVGHYVDATITHGFLRRAGANFQTIDLLLTLPQIVGFQLNGIDAAGRRGVGTGSDAAGKPYAFEVELP